VVYNGAAGLATALTVAARHGPVVVGSIAPEKGQLQFIEAARAIHDALPECLFRIHGAPVLARPEYAEQVRQAARGLPVEFPGWASNIYDALSSLDVLLVPSTAQEATTRVILEAFAAGVPVIAFPSGGIPEVIEDRRTGYLARSPAEMSRIAIELLRPTRTPGRGRPSRSRKLEQAVHLERFHEELLALLMSAGTSNSRNSRSR
jgi:glycosyltransferase involved in cell wall biosynthesis